MFGRLLRAIGIGPRTEQSMTGGPVPAAGDLLSVALDDGRFGVAKILVVTEGGLHVRLYVQRFGQRPRSIDPGQLSIAPFGPGHDHPLSIGHMPLTHARFAIWQPELIASGVPVRDEELEGYRIWLDDRGGYF